MKKYFIVLILLPTIASCAGIYGNCADLDGEDRTVDVRKKSGCSSLNGKNKFYDS